MIEEKIKFLFDNPYAGEEFIMTAHGPIPSNCNGTALFAAGTYDHHRPLYAGLVEMTYLLENHFEKTDDLKHSIVAFFDKEDIVMHSGFGIDEKRIIHQRAPGEVYQDSSLAFILGLKATPPKVAFYKPKENFSLIVKENLLFRNKLQISANKISINQRDEFI